jgi:hypothetical protein
LAHFQGEGGQLIEVTLNMDTDSVVMLDSLAALFGMTKEEVVDTGLQLLTVIAKVVQAQREG